MKKFRKFINTCFFGGIVVMLPVMLSIYLLKWFLGVILRTIQPITVILVEKAHMEKILAQGIIVLFVIMVFFFIGLAVKTRIGRFFFRLLESGVFKSIPGYNLFSQTIKQLIDKKKKPFLSVAIVQPFNNDTMLTGFITDKHPDGRYTVFVPSALNPTSGLIFHLNSQNVRPLKVSTENAMRTIIGCGMGSQKLMDESEEKLNP
jgi:uncharacterized membrane protein